ncbi:hypothetical protein JCM5350_007336 [Sporobolomyces pararoseus]
MNRRLLVKAIRSRSLLHLRRIIAIPPFMGNWVSGPDHRRQLVVQGGLEKVCKTFGIAIERTGIVGTYLHIGYGLEPYDEDSTTDDEEGEPELFESESEEEEE